MLKFSLKMFYAVLIIIILGGCFLLWQNMQPRAGKKVFDISSPPKEILINDIAFENINNVWQIKNLNEYYANTAFIKQMLLCFYNAEYVKKINVIDKPFNKVVVDGKKYEVFGNIIKNGNSYWLISYPFFTAENDSDYLLDPIPSLTYSDVNKAFINDVGPVFVGQGFVDEINNISIIAAKKDIKEALVKKVRLVLGSGLILTVSYYENNWLAVEFGAERISKRGIFEFVKNQNELTQGWFFKTL